MLCFYTSNQKTMLPSKLRILDSHNFYTTEDIDYALRETHKGLDMQMETMDEATNRFI